MPHVSACERVKVAECPARLPTKFIEALEQNQQISSCCRHPENHEIEAFYSNEDERWRGKDPERDSPNPPDIYIFYCSCGRQHKRFCVGGSGGGVVDYRPYWEVR